MKFFVTFVISIFLLSCSLNKKNSGISNSKTSHNKINISKAYSFQEYVNLLSNINYSKEFPNINNFPD